MKNHMRKIRILLSILAVSLLGEMTVARAQNASGERWQFEATPYVWLTNVDGRTRVGSLSADSSMSASDLLSNLDFGLQGALEARKGRWGILFDGTYAKISDSVGPVGVKLTQQIYSLGAAWRVNQGSTTPVDLIGGLRYNYIKPDLRTATLRSAESKDGIDPFVGVRGKLPLSQRWSLVGYGDIGTFRGENYSWQLLAGANYDINERMTAKVGYRAYKTKSSDDAFEVDTTMHGLYVGLGFCF